MPRHALGDRAMTSTERSARRRQRALRLRLAVAQVIDAWTAGIPARELHPLIEDLQHALAANNDR
jgi:hypothetical protein